MSKITKEQKDFLIDFMSKHYTDLFGKFSADRGKKNKVLLWQNLTTILNQAGPPNKTVEQWKRVSHEIVFYLFFFIRSKCIFNITDMG